MPGWLHRVRQGLLALWPRPEPDEAAVVRRWLNEHQRAAFANISAHDRGHLIRVARQLESQAPHHPDLIIAGALHDIGKADGSHRVRLIDRVAKVLLERTSPRLLAKLAEPPPGGIRSGLVLAVHHPEIGAERARALGCSDRVVWLIKHHEDSRIDDPELQLLIAIDQATP
jgi:hypothetical protein